MQMSGMPSCAPIAAAVPHPLQAPIWIQLLVAWQDLFTSKKTEELMHQWIEGPVVDELHGKVKHTPMCPDRFHLLSSCCPTLSTPNASAIPMPLPRRAAWTINRPFICFSSYVLSWILYQSFWVCLLSAWQGCTHPSADCMSFALWLQDCCCCVVPSTAALIRLRP